MRSEIIPLPGPPAPPHVCVVCGHVDRQFPSSAPAPDTAITPEPWLHGLTILECRDFEQGGTRWRELRLSDGSTVQMILAGPWLVLR